MLYELWLLIALSLCVIAIFPLVQPDPPCTHDGDAAPGVYHIAVGFYDATSGGRLPITDAKGQRLPNDRNTLPVGITIGGAR